jgi:hypothetical protein
MNGNWFAVFAVLAWPIVAVALYRTRSPVEATVWTILAAFLLLPSDFSIKLPTIPAMDKNSVPSVCALIGCVSQIPRRKRQSSGFGLVEVLSLMFIAGPVITSALNNDTIVIGDRVLPGVGYYDGISTLLTQILIFLPFVFSRRVFQNPEDTETTIRCLMFAGLFYSLPMLLEIRLSPQLCDWIYGFFPSTYSTEIRYGGFRPVVFLQNGLEASFFITTAFLAASAIWRIGDRMVPLPPVGPPMYIGLVLILCKSAGAMVYAIFGGFFVRCIKPRAQFHVALLLASIALCYPILRIADLFPDKILVQAAESIDQERAHSLQVRFDQERQLLDHASQRFFFGWGRYGRGRVYDESGKDSSITDGQWILTVGQFGLVGFLAQFGLLTWPVLRASRAFKFVKTERDRILLATLALLVAFGIVEQLPNASIGSWSWLLAGSLLGRAERLTKLAKERRKFGQGERDASSGVLWRQSSDARPNQQPSSIRKRHTG